jgi:transposase
MLPDRYVTSIESFLRSLPDKGKITHVAMDMWRPYRIAVSKELPQAQIVVDKFHFVSKANAAFETVRRTLSKVNIQGQQEACAGPEVFTQAIRQACCGSGRCAVPDGYTFERLRAKLLFTDRLQKRVTGEEKVKVRKKPRFDKIRMERMYCMLSAMAEDHFQIRIQAKQVNLGADLSTLEADFDAGKFGPIKA